MFLHKYTKQFVVHVLPNVHLELLLQKLTIWFREDVISGENKGGTLTQLKIEIISAGAGFCKMRWIYNTFWSAISIAANNFPFV